MDRGDRDVPVRTLAVWCPDWPVVAAGVPLDQPAAVIANNQVVACSAAARQEGVRRGLRRREAQARAPDLMILPVDEARDARAFEPVVAAVEALAPGVEILRPGLAVLAVKGAARYFGGEPQVIKVLDEAVRTVGHSARFGAADGSFAAVQAAYAEMIVPAGESAAFLAPLPVGALGDPDLADLLVRLGLPTLGAFAALRDEDVLARFGPDGRRRQRLARGLDERPPLARPAPPDLAVETDLDPPVERVDAATFVAKSLADRLVDLLAARGLSVTRVRVEAQTEHGEELARVWRYDDGFTAVALAERVRWQLDGWLSGTVGATTDSAPTAGVTLLRLVPVEVVGAGRQLGLWGEDSAADLERVERAVDRVLGLLGPTSVVTSVLVGGRNVVERIRDVPWGEPRGPDPVDALPWPGRLPVPSPASVLEKPAPASLTDAAGRPVSVSDRGVATAPVRLAVEGRSPVDLSGWAGPWSVDSRWWDSASRKRVRMQVVTAEDRAYLLVRESGSWLLEAVYD